MATIKGNFDTAHSVCVCVRAVVHLSKSYWPEAITVASASPRLEGMCRGQTLLILCGFSFSSSMNGVLEMDGFKATFGDLFRSTGSDADQITGSGDSLYMDNQTMYTQPSFCGQPAEMNATKNTSKTCGSGNTAGSASTLVSDFVVMPSKILRLIILN